jgi:hypothetical protein
LINILSWAKSEYHVMHLLSYHQYKCYSERISHKNPRFFLCNFKSLRESPFRIIAVLVDQWIHHIEPNLRYEAGV